MSFQTPITISDAIGKIDSNEFLLPAIQREFIWTHSKIEWLFDSIMRNYPISSFLFWNVEEKRPVYLFSKFNKDFQSEVPPMIENLIGLRASEVKKWGKPLRECLTELTELMEAAEYIVAHNGTGFDKPFLELLFSISPNAEPLS